MFCDIFKLYLAAVTKILKNNQIPLNRVNLQKNPTRAKQSFYLTLQIDNFNTYTES